MAEKKSMKEIGIATEGDGYCLYDSKGVSLGLSESFNVVDIYNGYKEAIAAAQVKGEAIGEKRALEIIEHEIKYSSLRKGEFHKGALAAFLLIQRKLSRLKSEGVKHGN